MGEFAGNCDVSMVRGRGATRDIKVWTESPGNYGHVISHPTQFSFELWSRDLTVEGLVQCGNRKEPIKLLRI